MKRLFGALFMPTTKLARWSVALSLAALFAFGTLGYLDPVRLLFDSEPFSFQAGDIRVSLYQLLKAFFIFIALFWIASLVSAAGASQLQKIEQIKASNRALLVTGFRGAVYFFLFLIGLDVLGINLTAFAVLGGALGIGIGFGLQKITANFISGLILLFEKSVEEGDLIELVDGTYGFIQHTGARYTLIETFNGKEIMIPNEDFMTSHVTNWTHSNRRGRVEIPVGVSYESDIARAQELMLEAAAEHPRCSHTPPPQCFLREYADSSVNFLLYFWVQDVTQGRMGPQSDVMFSIWKKFKQHGVEIPYPQRDLYIKNPTALK